MPTIFPNKVSKRQILAIISLALIYVRYPIAQIPLPKVIIRTV